MAGWNSDAATTQQEWQDAQAQESERGGLGNGYDADIPEDCRPEVVRIRGVINNLEIATERAAVAYVEGATANAGTELEDGASGLWPSGTCRAADSSKKRHSLARECPVKVCNRLFLSCLIQTSAYGG